MESPPKSKPPWLKKQLSLTKQRGVKSELRGLNLHSVCEEASCPNISECFSRGVATVMIMGDVCTRSCKFCNVKTGRPLSLDVNEPDHVATWVKAHGFKHIVITSVDRDDLKDDFGAKHFFQVVSRVKELNPNTTVEVLTPDFQGREDCIDIVCRSPISIFNHNLETIERLTPAVRSAANYLRSLKVIRYVKSQYPILYTKSGLMLGLGETEEEVKEAMKDLFENGCDLLTLGQYLQPSLQHIPVHEYVHPDQFKAYERFGKELGFKAVFSGPFVRSSYLADELLDSLGPILPIKS